MFSSILFRGLLIPTVVAACGLVIDGQICIFLLDCPVLDVILKALDKAVFTALIAVVKLDNPYYLDSPYWISEAPTGWVGGACGLNESELQFYTFLAAAVYCPTNPYVPGRPLDCCYSPNISQTITYYQPLLNCTSQRIRTKALVTVHPSREEIVLTYRGTRNIQNVMLDFKMKSANVPVPPGSDNQTNIDIKIHEGFENCTLSLYYRAIEVLHRLIEIHPGYRITFNGHSLGGAMASLTAFFVLRDDEFPNSQKRLVTFGQPRVGNRDYATYMDMFTHEMDICRVVNRADVVPHYVAVDYTRKKDPQPSECYVHHMQEVWINPQNELKYCSLNHYEDKNCSNSMSRNYDFYDHLKYLNVDFTACFLQKTDCHAPV